MAGMERAVPDAWEHRVKPSFTRSGQREDIHPILFLSVSVWVPSLRR